MARIQILELPEGAGDERPPFVLVVDQVPRSEQQYEALRRDIETNDIAAHVGARTVLVFEETIDIPANQVPVGPDGYPVRVHVEGEFEKFREQVEAEIRAAQRKATAALGLDRERKAAITDALGMDRLRDWDDIANAARGLRKSNDARGEAIDRVLNLPYQPEIMDAQHTEPTGYQHGYRIAIQDAKRAVGHQSEHPTQKQSRA